MVSLTGRRQRERSGVSSVDGRTCEEGKGRGPMSEVTEVTPTTESHLHRVFPLVPHLLGVSFYGVFLFGTRTRSKGKERREGREEGEGTEWVRVSNRRP